MLTSSRRPGTIHAGTHRCKAVRGVLGFVMSCTATVLLLWVLIQLFQEDEISASSMQLAAGLAVAACVLFYLGSTWFFSFVTGHAHKLAIGERDVQYGAANFSWPQVSRIGVRTKRGAFQVHLVLNRAWLASRWLVTDDGMSRGVAEVFIEALRTQVLPRFPHLDIEPLMAATPALGIDTLPRGAEVKPTP